MKTSTIKQLLLGAAIVFLTNCTMAQTKDQFNVAIFLYDGMELLDFAGPTEVFAAAGFNTYSVTFDGNPVQCNHTGGILNKISPDYSMSNAPAPDVVVFPGGGTEPISKNEDVIKWVKNRASQGTFLMSVCTGAAVLANTGLLAGKNITTWYGFIPALQSQHPELKVLESTRFVDNGIYLTTAGVSAGIDGALHLVSRIKGLDIAKSVAKYMEYDKWNPEMGRVDVQNEFINQLRNQKITPEKFVTILPKGSAMPYEGEFKNLAAEYSHAGNFQEAARILELCLKIYPKSSSTGRELAKVYKSLGKAAPEDEDYYLALLKESKFAQAFDKYEADSKKFPGWTSVNHGGKITSFGISEFNKGNFEAALKAFQFVATTDPEYGSFYNVGEAQMKMGKNKEAIASYEKCLEYVPNDEDVKQILNKLNGSGQ